MQISHNQILPVPSYRHSTSPKTHPTAQHESVNSETRISLLLDIPVESLTHITSSLEPPALLALSGVNKTLYTHIKDDNTWYRAFAHQLLGVSPESDLGITKSLMLRRCEATWKQEFLLRYTLQKQWELSNNSTITHIPHHSPVKSIHLMATDLLLASSLQYGVVSRSQPFTGKVLRGYLDASGTGLGIGNPNAEFTPNVTTCAISSDGGTAKILWGLVSGDVRLLSASKAADTRASQNLLPCSFEHSHRGSVLDAVWDKTKADRAVTCALDGTVKIWETRNMIPLSSFALEAGSWCYKISSSLLHGTLACASAGGECIVWTSIDTSTQPSRWRVPSLAQNATDHAISSLDVDTSSLSPAILLAYEEEPVFHRVNITDRVESIQFGDAEGTALSLIQPFFARSAQEQSFIVTGDSLGTVNIFDWNSSSPHPVYRFEAFKDSSAVTSVAWNEITLIVGSANGVVGIFDSLTFANLRVLMTQPEKWRAAGQGRATEKNSITQILIGGGKDTVMVSAGSSVMAFRAGPVAWGRNSRGGGPLKHKGLSKKARNTNAKYFKKLELDQSINESRRIMEQEHTQRQQTFGREREHRDTLNHLGLSEAEAVAYMLMLSRDEEEQRRESSSAGHDQVYLSEEGVFEGDFDSEDSITHALNRASLASHTEATSSRLASWTSVPSSTMRSQALSEPMEAPFLLHPVTGSSAPVAVPPTVTDSDHFPSFSPSNSSGVGGSSIPNAKSVWASGSTTKSSSSVWSRSPRSSVAASPPATTAHLASSPSASGQGASGGAGGASGAGGLEMDDMDEDLRFAIELSLAEARSRGEAV